MTSVYGQPRLRVGFVGLGRMGEQIALNVARTGLLAGVYNRTASKAESLARTLAVRRYQTPGDLAADVSVVMTCLADAAAVFDVCGGPSGVAANMRAGTIVVEMSTIGLDAVRDLHGLVTSYGGELVDAPVSGSTVLAATAQLTVMAGGTRTAFERLRPLLDAVGAHVFHMGPVGSGAAMKLSVNNLVYGLNQSLAESLVLAERAGIERGRAYDVFATSAAGAPFVSYRRSAFERPGEVRVAMPLTLAQKDLALICELAEEVGANLPQAKLNAEVAEAARVAGFGAHDVSAIAEHLRGKDGLGTVPSNPASTHVGVDATGSDEDSG